MTGKPHLRLVNERDTPRLRAAQLTFGALTPHERGETNAVRDLKPAREVLAGELERLAARLRAKGGLG